MSIISWSDFKKDVDARLPKQRRFSVSGPGGGSRPLFRGHASDKWLLQSTLERRTAGVISLESYMGDCISVRRYAGNFAAHPVPFDENISLDYAKLAVEFPNFQYLAFLRHHGFPSPFLDWTESPYVAAFFAFRNRAPHDATSARVYLYQSDIGQGRGYCRSNPHLNILGPFVTVHERHAIQQCWYTISIKDEGSGCVFCSHEEALSLTRSEGNLQDKIEWYDLNLADREEALADLYTMNISAFTLFRSLDALMETASHRIFEKE